MLWSARKPPLICPVSCLGKGNFFLDDFVRNGFDRAKLLYWASHAKLLIPYDQSMINDFCFQCILNEFVQTTTHEQNNEGPKSNYEEEHYSCQITFAVPNQSFIRANATIRHPDQFSSTNEVS